VKRCSILSIDARSKMSMGFLRWRRAAVLVGAIASLALTLGARAQDVTAVKFVLD